MVWSIKSLLLTLIAFFAVSIPEIAAGEKGTALLAYPQLHTFRGPRNEQDLSIAALKDALWFYRGGRTLDFENKLHIIREQFPTTDAGKFANLLLRGVLP